MRSKAANVLLIVTGVACHSGDEQLVARLTDAAYFLESSVSRLESTTTSGSSCYPLIDGWVRYRIQDFGANVAKDVRQFEAFFDFATVVLGVYKTPVGERFNALALRYNQWKKGTYAAAVEGCKRCASRGENPDEDSVPIRNDLEGCHVP